MSTPGIARGRSTKGAKCLFYIFAQAVACLIGCWLEEEDGKMVFYGTNDVIKEQKFVIETTLSVMSQDILYRKGG